MWRDGVEEGVCGGTVWRKECVEEGEGVEGRVWREVYIVWKGMWGGVHGVEGMWGRCTWCGGGGVHIVEGMWGRRTWCGGGGIYSVKEGEVCRGRGMDGMY